MNTVIIAPVGLLIVVAVIVGLVMLVRALPPGSGPKVALAVAGLIAFGLLFTIVGYQRMNVAVKQPTVMRREHPPMGYMVRSETVEVRTEPDFVALRWLIVVAVIVGLVVLFRALSPDSRPKVALGLGVLVALMLGVFFVSPVRHQGPYSAAGRQEPPETRSIRQSSGREQNAVDDIANARLTDTAPSIDNRKEPKRDPSASEASVNEPEPKSFSTAANDSPPNGKPAWLAQGLQTGNGVTQFVVTSELFQTVGECQRDLNERMSPMIADEVRTLRGEDGMISLEPHEAQRLIVETYTEEFPITSNGTWYKVHRLIKIDEPTWAIFRMRFQQAQLHARLVSLGLALGGVMLILGVVYLFLRRQPRVVDPTLNTFSTT
jgi:hypothetical protein